jgi:Beta-lactamase/DDE domain
MSKSRIPTWVSLILLGVGLLAAGIPGLFVYMRVTATKVHPDSQKIPSVMESPPLAKWAGTAEQARQIVRTSISENNLAGLSIAVGIDGEIVWREGFGFADIENGSPVTPSHRFRTGTASIVLTSAAIGLLLDEGRLNLDDEIQKYVPGELRQRCRCRRAPYLNNILEQDHGFVKKRILASQWFRSVDGALNTIAGYEAMNIMRKGQIRWVAKNDVLGQIRFIERTFGVAA